MRRSIKSGKRLFIDVLFATLALALIVGVSVFTLHRHPSGKMLAEAPATLQGSVTH